MKYNDIFFDETTTHKILKNLCVTLKANNIKHICAFNTSGDIQGIKCGKLYISSPRIKTTELLFKVTEDTLLWGLFDKNHLLKYLQERTNAQGGSIMNNKPEPKNSPKITISKSAHGTVDVVVYNLPSIKMVDFFMLFDIWGSRGYDRFNDDGLYFEVPAFVYDIIEDIPFIKTNHIEVVKG